MARSTPIKIDPDKLSGWRLLEDFRERRERLCREAPLHPSFADCRELQAFTLDPVEQTHRFRVRQDRRQHLHQQIEKHSLDMTHVTDRKGSPQTLVCTKDRRSYKRRCDQYRKDIAALTSLAEQAREATVKNDDALKHIETARALAANWSPG